MISDFDRELCGAKFFIWDLEVELLEVSEIFQICALQSYDHFAVAEFQSSTRCFCRPAHGTL